MLKEAAAKCDASRRELGRLKPGITMPSLVSPADAAVAVSLLTAKDRPTPYWSTDALNDVAPFAKFTLMALPRVVSMSVSWATLVSASAFRAGDNVGAGVGATSSMTKGVGAGVGRTAA